ncbi:DUF4197 domain-containing protein [Flavobacterium agrisoli]|uniref:DUF4197 domain-containing protein n=1 Tax=Flavobacterium agrisoli TaxID=2793066 RepID=A0A934UJ67_9FLAO|nr:DUF4197 domain-containing protein [Flavobacterium agrisoli]MBK0369090.1 DUF4197 domain-containing protein [Flavobacterium agrisoli]
MKKIFFLILGVSLNTFAQNLPSLSQIKNLVSTGTATQLDIASGLKEALNKGVSEQVTKLTAQDGFYKNELVKIVLPDELQKVDATLRRFGLGSLADEGIKVMNRAAEDAVKEATPIFVDAITKMTFSDAKNILLGNENAATNYLQTATSTSLYSKLSPVVKNSFDKVGADGIWKSIITKYNTLPLTKDVNPDLTDYVTNQTLSGVFKMIAVEEKEIRSDLTTRTSPLLKEVFALQDSK